MTTKRKPTASKALFKPCRSCGREAVDLRNGECRVCANGRVRAKLCKDSNHEHRVCDDCWARENQ